MTTESQNIIVIGGGPAGLEAAACLGNAGYEVTVLEKEEHTGGKLRSWYKLFPGFRNSDDVLEYLSAGVQLYAPKIITGARVVGITGDGHKKQVNLADGQSFIADTVLIATGFQVYKAERKEEYGYQIYDNVITSVGLEEKLKDGFPLKTIAGTTPRRIAFIHCVGSRDKKAGHIYCSRICCITGVKQAIEVKQHLPDAEIFNFYMDMRMFGQNFEELYLEAQQEYGVTFIRGRVSEIGENPDGSLQLKAEDTLSGRPMKMSFDLVVLLVGMVSAEGTEMIAKSAHLNFTSGNFLAGSEPQISQNVTNIPGIFICGTCREPLSIAETLTDARAASIKIISWLRSKETKN